jgi:Mrp family chromosome partitioning ATPase
MVTSPSSADGKTFVARGLAQVAAQGGRKVLLVDGDLRARALSRSLGRANAPGLSDAVVDAKQGRCEDVDDLAVDIAFDGAAVRFLPAGTETPNPSSLLHRPIVHGLFEALPDAQLVIIDTPPAAALPDALLLATVADQVVVVARARVTRREELSAVVAMLARRLPDKLIGVVVIGPSEHASYPTAPPRGEARAAVAS